MKKFVALLLTAFFVLSIPINAGAAHIVGIKYGDVNLDFNVDMVDVTLIQRALVLLESFDEIQKEAADFDHDGTIAIEDVTLLQRNLVEMEIPKNCGGHFEYHSELRQIYADYASGKAMAGIPITFTAQGGYSENDLLPNSFFAPLLYRFQVYEVKDEHLPLLIFEQEFSDNNLFTYVFDNAGVYDIKVTTCNRFKAESTLTLKNYRVVQPYSTETPVITSVYTDKYGNIAEGGYTTKYKTSCRWDEMTISVIAKGGSGDYKFAFELNTEDKTAIQDFSTSNSFTIDKADFPGWKEYSEIKRYPSIWNVYDPNNVDSYPLTIRVMDSNGNEYSETVQIGAIYDFDLLN